MPKSSTTLTCTLRQFLFSPKGHIEGFLAKFEGQTIQIRVPPHVGDALSRTKKIGQKLAVRGELDKSPKAKKGVHPVFEFASFGDKSGADIAEEGKTVKAKIKGVVAHLHYAKHGEPNGVILKSGEFVHLRPHGMKATGLEIGSEVSVAGHRKTTALGTTLIEAAEVNGVEID